MNVGASTSSAATPPAQAKPLLVVCALIRDDAGRLLVAQRPEHKHLGLKWEFPGGKVEPGEDPAEAIRREIREELGCDVELDSVMPTVGHHHGDITLALMPFPARLAAESPRPVALEHNAINWLSQDELAQIDLAPADRIVAKNYFDDRHTCDRTDPKQSI